MRTLHISDLDGTLLRGDGLLDPIAVKSLQSLINTGLLFSLATARSPVSVANLFKDVPLKLPLILLNGALLLHNDGHTILKSDPLDNGGKKKLLELERSYGLEGFKCLDVDGRLRYGLPTNSDAWNRFATYHSLTIDEALCIDSDEISGSHVNILYVYYIDKKPELLKSLQLHLGKTQTLDTDYYKDRYLADVWFFEVFSIWASKGKYVELLRQLAGAHRTIGYGDSANDLSLLEKADFFCAVSNAQRLIIESADLIIGSNEDNGVVRFIESNQWRADHVL